MISKNPIDSHRAFRDGDSFFMLTALPSVPLSIEITEEDTGQCGR